jgi:hypothetical protein
MRSQRVPSRARRGESGWVLAASLVLSTLAVAVTVTYARHAVLAKKSLEFAQGASAVEEASRSGMERVRERMRDGDCPGTVDQGTQDHCTTPGGQDVTGERKVLTPKQREIRVRATGPSATNSSDEFRTKAKSNVQPSSKSKGKVQSTTTLSCPDGTTVLAGNITIISGPVQYIGVELSGLFILQDDAVLTLQDVVLRGTILTNHGVCKDHPQATQAHRPQLKVYGGLRLISGNDIPKVAICAPDMVMDCDASSRVEIDGFACADEVNVKGKGRVHGMVVSNTDEDISSKVKRPGHGRGCEDYPDTIDCGAEDMTSVVFPNTPIPDSTLDAMIGVDLDG